MNKEAKLKLEDGTVITGKSFGSERSAAGEVVFNTAMTGYIESLTDPSYKGQILVLTYPLVGNYGVPSELMNGGIPEYFESGRIQVSGLIISDYSFEYSHWSAVRSLSEWLKSNDVPALFDVDTRSLTKKIREQGTLLGKVIFDGNEPDWYNPDEENLVEKVSVKGREEYGDGKHKIMLVDCGAKNNILRCLLKRDTTVVRVPWDYDLTSEDFDGMMVSNGPGDPKKCEITINNLSGVMEKEKPVFGICLGNQLLGLASGADTFKLKYGHRSHNQPVIQSGTKRTFITSQNHGFALDEKSLGADWEALFLNLNDNTVEGIKHKTKPFFSSQFHPEASSGPTDTEYLFDEFLDLVKKYKSE